MWQHHICRNEKNMQTRMNIHTGITRHFLLLLNIIHIITIIHKLKIYARTTDPIASLIS